MNTTETVAATPRWGNEGRDRKADAILTTLVSVCGEDIRRGAWLDIGCGSGGIASAIAPSVHQITGIDPEPWPAWAAMTAAQPNLTFKVAGFDSEHLPLPENTIDVVICNQVYEHVAQPEQLIRNIHRVLRPGGVCYFAGPNLLWPIEPHVCWPFVHWLPRHVALRLMRALGSDSANELDAYSVTLWQLSAWFKATGLIANDSVVRRLAIALDLAHFKIISRFVRRIPDSVAWCARPFWPSFVFVLMKSK